MSDVSQGEGWWLASDGKWYPPQPPAPVGGPAPSGFQPMSSPTGPAKTSSLAVTSLVLGVVSIVTSFTCIIGLLTAIPGLITGITAKRQIRESNGAEQGEGLATGGIITSAIALGLMVVFVVLIVAVTFLGKSVSSKFSSVGSAVAGRVVVAR